MRLLQLLETLRRQRKTLVRVALAVLALLVVIDSAPFLVDKQHAHTELERFPGFWSAFGLVSCTLLIFLSKWFGHAGIMQPEDYYDE